MNGMLFNRQRISYSILFFLFIGTLGGISLFSLPAYATDYAEKANDIQEALAEKKASHEALVKKSNALNLEMMTLKNNLVSVSKDLRASEENMSDTDQRLKELRQKRENYLQDLYKDHRDMGGLISAIQKYSRTSVPNMLMQSDPIDAARTSIIMKSMMPRLQQQSTYLKQQLAKIDAVEADIASQIQIQTQQNKRLNKQQEELARFLQERKKIYQATESERRTQEEAVAKLTKESKNLEELIAKLKSKNQDKDSKKTARAELPANMLLPVHGKVHTHFGDKDDLGANSKGITFDTRAGAGVVVPLAGVVKFAGAFQKYKQILIVEHQGGYHSLIAGLARVDTVVGASLAAGEPVGIADSSTSPQIYYELRQNGKPVNPQKLLVAQRKQEKS